MTELNLKRKNLPQVINTNLREVYFVFHKSYKTSEGAVYTLAANSWLSI